MMVPLRQLVRAVCAEFMTLGGRRSPLLLAALPGAVLLPLVVTFGVATVAERFESISDTIRITSVTTTNAVYWVIIFTASTWAVIAAAAQANAVRGASSDLQRYLFPRAWTGSLARWVVYGLLAAVNSAILVVVVLVVLPKMFSTVYGDVDLASAEGLRFLWAVPVYAVVTSGLGLGVGAVVGHPVAAASGVLGWQFIVENAVALIPNGYTIQGYMPFLNGQFGTGQQLAFSPPWGLNGALIYALAVAAVVLALGCGAIYLRRR